MELTLVQLRIAYTVVRSLVQLWTVYICAGTIMKADGSVRVCGDYKVTVNQSLDVDQYPLPKPEDLFATVANGQVFSKLDLSQAYQQMLLDEESKKYVTINTHLGLYSTSFILLSAVSWFVLPHLDNALQLVWPHGEQQPLSP